MAGEDDCNLVADLCIQQISGLGKTQGSGRPRLHEFIGLYSDRPELDTHMHIHTHHLLAEDPLIASGFWKQYWEYWKQGLRLDFSFS